MTAEDVVLVECALGVAEIDLEAEEVVRFSDSRHVSRAHVDVSLPLVIDAAGHGSLVVAVVDRRPPLVVSTDAGISWHEAGAGLPAGRAVAISPEHPDRILFATASRLYLSEDGGRFWRALAPELIDIVTVAWEE